MNYTDELGLKLPELDEAFDLENHWNFNTQKLDDFAAMTNTAVGTLESGLASAQSQIAALQGGVHLKGSVNYYADLPVDPDDGDAYTVLYFGTSGQEPAGIEYAWVDAQESWIPIGVDPAAFAKPADITAAIAALDAASAGGSGKYIKEISQTDGVITPVEGTIDASPIANSQNPVTSGGVATSIGVLTPAAIKAVDEGAKNKLKNSAASATSGEAVFTVNSDGSVSVYTTATTTASRTLTITGTADNCYVNTGDIITGNPTTNLDVAIQYGIGSSGNIANYNPDEQYHTITVSGIVRYCLISIRSGVSISQSSPLVFKPMICTAQDWAVSQKFVPYCPTNRELYESKADKNSFSLTLNSGLTSFTINKYWYSAVISGDIVTINFRITSSDNISSGQYGIFVIPSGFRPPKVTVAGVGCIGASYSIFSGWANSGNGMIYINIGETVTAGTTITFSVSYSYNADKWTEYTAPSDRSLPSENLTNGAGTAEEEPGTLTKAEVDDDVRAETDNTGER